MEMLMGRPKKYASAAEKMSAYRQRKTKEIDEMRAKAEAIAQPPKIVEKVVERLVTVPVKRTSRKSPKSPHPKIGSTDRQRVINERFTGQYGGEDAAIRFRVNTKKAATATLEIKNLLESLPYEKRLMMTADIERLEQAAEVLNIYSDTFAVTQREAASAQKTRANKQQREEEARIAATVLELFGAPPDPQVIISMASDLVSFATEIESWASKHRGADKALIDFDEFEIKRALRNSNVTILAQAVAKARIQVPSRGQRHESKDGRWWHGGWEDFIAWRADPKSAS
jgi:hypothetical protein